MEKVGILGGTFDPVHNGHMYLARTALEKCKLDRIMFLPLNVPPHKPSPVADSHTRFSMVEECIKDIPEFFLSDMEINRQGTTYTVDTLKELKSKHPDWDIYYIIGTDTLFDLEKWRCIEKVFTLCSFICMSRPGENIKAQQDFADKLSMRYNSKIFVIETMGKDVSSSMIRRSCAKDLYELVPKEITDKVIEIYAKDEKNRKTTIIR